MRKRYLLILPVLAAFVLAYSVTVSHADLIDRGGGLIYDTDLNITWLQDANYAKTAGYDADGLMTWEQAMTWADSLVYFDALRGVSYDNWRLPSAGAAPASAFNQTAGELGHLFYNELGGTAASSIMASADPDIALFSNIQLYVYWFHTEYALSPSDGAWAFYFYNGVQGAGGKNNPYYAWAVRDGDVAPVPEPSTLLLLGAGLVSIIPLRRIIRPH